MRFLNSPSWSHENWHVNRWKKRHKNKGFVIACLTIYLQIQRIIESLSLWFKLLIIRLLQIYFWYNYLLFNQSQKKSMIILLHIDFLASFIAKENFYLSLDKDNDCMFIFKYLEWFKGWYQSSLRLVNCIPNYCPENSRCLPNRKITRMEIVENSNVNYRVNSCKTNKIFLTTYRKATFSIWLRVVEK